MPYLFYYLPYPYSGHPSYKHHMAQGMFKQEGVKASEAASSPFSTPNPSRQTPYVRAYAHNPYMPSMYPSFPMGHSYAVELPGAPLLTPLYSSAQ